MSFRGALARRGIPTHVPRSLVLARGFRVVFATRNDTWKLEILIRDRSGFSSGNDACHPERAVGESRDRLRMWQGPSTALGMTLSRSPFQWRTGALACRDVEMNGQARRLSSTGHGTSAEFPRT